MIPLAGARERIGRVIVGVLRQAVQDAAAPGVVLADAETPEGALAHEWCVAAVGPARVMVGSAPSGWLTAHPANKTALLLAELPRSILLPLGDVYASAIAELTGSWSAPEPVPQLAALAGDVACLDAALRRWAEERRPTTEAFAELPAEAARALVPLLQRNRLGRRHCGLVPKLGGRTLGIDLWE